MQHSGFLELGNRICVNSTNALILGGVLRSRGEKPCCGWGKMSARPKETVWPISTEPAAYETAAKICTTTEPETDMSQTKLLIWLQ